MNAYSYEGEPSLRTGTLHVFYEVMSGWDVGVAYSAEEYWRYAYLETMYVNGANSVEAYYGATVGDEYKYYGIEYSRDFGAIGSLGDVGAYVGYAEQTAEWGNITNPYVGATVGLGNGFELDARYASMADDEYRYISFGITREFGAGTTFSDRGFAGMFPGY